METKQSGIQEQKYSLSSARGTENVVILLGVGHSIGLVESIYFQSAPTLVGRKMIARKGRLVQTSKALSLKTLKEWIWIVLSQQKVNNNWGGGSNQKEIFEDGAMRELQINLRRNGKPHILQAWFMILIAGETPVG